MKLQFVGYATDCVIGGEVNLDGDRLTDLLAGAESYVVTSTTLEVLDNDRS